MERQQSPGDSEEPRALTPDEVDELWREQYGQIIDAESRRLADQADLYKPYPDDLEAYRDNTD